MIAIRNLTRRYGSIVAVQDVSLEIERGEVVGLLGHNGAGKTTVMKILTGYLEPSSGSVRVGDIDVVQDRQGVQRQIGYLPENAPLYPEMLVQDYLLMMAELRGLPPDQQRSAAVEAAEATGLIPRLTQRIGTLSKGYRQRVGIAQAILHKPDVLVLDEPTNGLDPMQIQAIRELVRELGERITVVLSTHILSEIEAVCSRVLVMIDGHLAADGPLDDLLSTHTVRVDVAGGDAHRAQLAALEGAQQVRRLPERPTEPELIRYAVDHEPGAALVPAIVDLASEADWDLRAVYPEQRTLEQVFEELQARFIARQRGEAA